MLSAGQRIWELDHRLDAGRARLAKLGDLWTPDFFHLAGIRLSVGWANGWLIGHAMGRRQMKTAEES